MEFRIIYIEQIPIPTPPLAQHEAIGALVRKLLDAKGQGPQVAEWERELNAVVYEVYGLTSAETAVVEDFLETQARRRELKKVTTALDALRREP